MRSLVTLVSVVVAVLLCGSVLGAKLQVVVADGGSPVAGALVRVWPGALSKNTNASGLCEFAGLTAGNYQVVASKDIGGVYKAARNDAVVMPATGILSINLALSRAIMINEYLPRVLHWNWRYHEVITLQNAVSTRTRYEDVVGTRTMGSDTVTETKISWSGTTDTFLSLERSLAKAFAMYGEDRVTDLILYDPPLSFENPMPEGYTFHVSTTATHTDGSPNQAITMQVTLMNFDSVTVPYGTFTDCPVLEGIQTIDGSPQTFLMYLAKDIGIVKMFESKGAKHIRRELESFSKIKIPKLIHPRLIPKKPLFIPPVEKPMEKIGQPG